MTLLKRLKTLIFAISTSCSLWTAPLIAAGTTPLSLVQQFDQTAIGQPLSGCLLYFFVAGTVATPQNAFADFGLTAPLSNPVQCDQSGRVPQHWLADGLIHIRLTDSSGVVQVDTTMQVLGPSSGGGGGGGTVDPTTLLATGDLKVKYGTGPISGFVRSNALTIGNATCGCSERANADTQNLFIYLYNSDTNLAVSGGRSGNALNDYNANKQLTLPDWRGRAIAALDDMGNSAAGRLTAGFFGTAATVLGAAGGNQSATLLATQLPANIPYTDPGHNHTYGVSQNRPLYGSAPNNPAWNGDASSTTGNAATNITINPSGGSAHAIVSPMLLATVYLKL